MRRFQSSNLIQRQLQLCQLNVAHRRVLTDRPRMPQSQVTGLGSVAAKIKYTRLLRGQVRPFEFLAPLWSDSGNIRLRRKLFKNMAPKPLRKIQRHGFDFTGVDRKSRSE